MTPDAFATRRTLAAAIAHPVLTLASGGAATAEGESLTVQMLGVAQKLTDQMDALSRRIAEQDETIEAQGAQIATLIRRVRDLRAEAAS